MWQDIVVLSANIAMIPSLIPLLKRRGTPRITAFVTSVGLMLISITMFSLELYLSGTIIAVLSTVWAVILWRG